MAVPTSVLILSIFESIGRPLLSRHCQRELVGLPSKTPGEIEDEEGGRQTGQPLIFRSRLLVLLENPDTRGGGLVGWAGEGLGRGRGWCGGGESGVMQPHDR